MKKPRETGKRVGRYVVAGAMAFLWATALSGEEPSVLRLPVESYRLPNGLKVALSHEPGAPRTAVCVAYHVGSKNERAGLTGFAHFFEHMMFRGTHHVPNFDVPLQAAGGSPNAFTSEDVTVYFETIPNNYLERALYMEANRMEFLSSALDQEKFDTEREVVKNERRQRMENAPYGLASETLSATVYPEGHPYSWSVIGSMDDLNRATLDDLRRFFYEFYHPGNATLTLLGGFDPDEAKLLIEKYFGCLSAGSDLQPVTSPATPAQAKRIVQKDRVQFPRVYLAWPTVEETSEDAAALDLLSSLLSSGDASRLEKTLVRDKQMAIQVNASSNVNEIGGMFVIDAVAAPQATVEDLEKQIAAELDKIRETPPEADELQRVKTKLRTSQLVGLTSPNQRTIVIALGLAQHNDPHYYEEQLKRLEAVTPEDLQRVAGKYLVADHVVLVVEPVKPGEEESVAVKSGPLPSDQPAAELKPRKMTGGPDWDQMPDPSPRGTFSPPSFTRHQLSNGMEVRIAPWTTLPLVTARLLVNAGSADNSPDEAGLASLTARLWDKGTGELTATQFAEALDALGTSLSVAAGSDTTQMSFTVEKQGLAGTLKLIGSLIAQPRFDLSDFEREKKLHLSALVSGTDSPSWIAQRVFTGLLYGKGHPYSTPSMGFVPSVEGITLDQVKTYYRTRFVPQNATLIVVGDVKTDDFLTQLEEALAGWKSDTAVEKRHIPDGQAPGGVVYVVDKPGSVQSVISVGRVWRDRRDDTYFATRIGNRVLGGDFLSRINQNLRERNGYTYGARSGFQFHRVGGDWTTTTSVRADVTGAALREIIRELDALRGDRPLSADEIRSAQDAELNVFPQSFETPSSIAAVLSQLAIYDLDDQYLKDYLVTLAATEQGEVDKAMQEMVEPEARTILVVGDRQRVVPQLKDAGFEDIRFIDSDGKPVKE